MNVHKITEGLNFILSHFPTEEEPLFPRTASTYATDNTQVDVFNKEHALALFEEAEGLDLKLAGYPKYDYFVGKGELPGVMCLKKCFCS